MNAHKWRSDCLKKTRYSSHGQATAVAKKAEKKRGTKLRVYYCSHCQGHHLTKKPHYQK